jgi:hypothetical protein
LPEDGDNCFKQKNGRWTLPNEAIIVGTCALFDFLQSAVIWSLGVRYSLHPIPKDPYNALLLGRRSKYSPHENNNFIVHIF